MQSKSIYLPDTVYHALLDDLLAAHSAFDARTRVIELLGEVVNVWPQMVLDDAERNQAKSGGYTNPSES